MDKWLAEASTTADPSPCTEDLYTRVQRAVVTEKAVVFRSTRPPSAWPPRTACAASASTPAGDAGNAYDVQAGHDQTSGHRAGRALGRRHLLDVALLLAPGDTIDILIGDGADTPEYRARIVAAYGARPSRGGRVPSSYLWRLLHGDLGRSYQLQRGVGEILATQVGPTLQLTLAAAATGVSLAGVIALATAGRGRWSRGAASAAELVSVSVPPFLIGIVLLSVFSFTFGWFPVSGASGPQALVLPALALGLPIAGVLGQVLRGGLERALEQPFAVTARARGLTERALVARHALRHALIPAVTLAGWFTGTLLGGTVITEVLFCRPGARPGRDAGGHGPGHAGRDGRGAAVGGRVRDHQHAARPGLPRHRPQDRGLSVPAGSSYPPPS